MRLDVSRNGLHPASEGPRRTDRMSAAMGRRAVLAGFVEHEAEVFSYESTAKAEVEAVFEHRLSAMVHQPGLRDTTCRSHSARGEHIRPAARRPNARPSASD